MQRGAQMVDEKKPKVPRLRDFEGSGRFVPGPAAGMGIGVALGVVLGVVMDNIALGIALGVALGAGIGAGVSRRRKK
ncbi:MAG: hypothetical protein Kow00124_25670 [Anaerolineae bacterium]